VWFARKQGLRNQRDVLCAHQNQNPSELVANPEFEQSQSLHREGKAEGDRAKPASDYCEIGNRNQSSAPDSDLFDDAIAKTGGFREFAGV